MSIATTTEALRIAPARVTHAAANQETELTPELAAQLLANPHPRQRRIDPQTVARYVRTIEAGRWRLIPDPILVAGAAGMFNGGHRCTAVIKARRSIPVHIDWTADPDLFDHIDIGRGRSPYQFITDKSASIRAAAARVTLWYYQRFYRALQAGPTIRFDLEEILEETERRSDAFDAMLPGARTTYQFTTLPEGICLGAYAIAFDMDLQEQVGTFVSHVADPADMPKGEPCRLLADRFRKQDNRGRRRNMVDDWTILVRALNLHLEGKTTSRLVLSDFWPLVGETDADFNRRRNALVAARKTHDEGTHREEKKAGR